MKKYKLKKNFLYLKTGDTVEITRVKDLWAGLPRYIISKNQWIIVEILDSTRFVFEEYFEELKEEGKPKSIFNLKKWDKYYYLFGDWDIGLYYNYWTEIDKDIVKIWSAFLTEEEAKKEAERRKAIFNIKKYCFENNIEYKENISDADYCTTIKYNFSNDVFSCIFLNTFNTYWFLFFAYEDDVQKIIDNCLDDLRIIFEVE